jgi:Skp family chaperone for outer membrane proteins
MKTKMIVFVCIAVCGISFLSLGYTSAQQGSPLSKIGTVDIQRVYEDCDAIKTFSEKLNAEMKTMTAQEDQLTASIQALETELDSGALRIGSQDFFDRNRELAQKRSELSYLKDFNKSEQALKGQLWKMDIYKKILDMAKTLGKEKDLYLVLAVEETDLSPQRAEEFANVVRSHKVLYSGGCLDLTDEVIARLNKETKSGN